MDWKNPMGGHCGHALLHLLLRLHVRALPVSASGCALCANNTAGSDRQRLCSVDLREVQFSPEHCWLSEGCVCEKTLDERWKVY